MTTGSDLIVFIMARGGSTRLKLKNVIPVHTRALISYTLEHVGNLQRRFPEADAVVMTDHPDVESTARSDPHFPTRCAVERQTDFEASDHREWYGIRRVLQDREAEGRFYSFVMLLGADCVFRTNTLLCDAYERIRGLADGQLMVQSAMEVPIKWHPARLVLPSTIDGEAIRPFPDSGGVLSQSYQRYFALTGGVFAVRRARLEQGLESVESRINVLVTPFTHEVDTKDDLEEANLLLASPPSWVAACLSTPTELEK